MYGPSLLIPETGDKLVPGVRLRLRRFDTITWVVNYGWYSCDGNREVCGWYLIDEHDCHKIKPLSKPDVFDIIVLER